MDFINERIFRINFGNNWDQIDNDFRARKEMNEHRVVEALDEKNGIGAELDIVLHKKEGDEWGKDCSMVYLMRRGKDGAWNTDKTVSEPVLYLPDDDNRMEQILETMTDLVNKHDPKHCYSYQQYKQKYNLGTRYYNKELGIDGTADQLFWQVSEGYFYNNLDAMNKISEFLDGEGEEHRARYVRANIALYKEDHKGPYSNNHAIAFYIFLSEVEICKSEGCPKSYKASMSERHDDYEMENGTFSHITINGSYDPDDDTIVFSVSESNPEYSKDNAVKFPYDKVKDWTAEDFDKAMNEILYYAPANYVEERE